MKKIILFAILFTILIASCDRKELLPQSQQSEEIQKGNPENAISVAEKELGISLVTKDLTISDASEKNSVVFRFGARDLKTIDSYLSSVTYVLKPISKQEKEAILSSGNQEQRISTESAGNDKESVESIDKNFGIFSDLISKNLSEGVVGYSLEVTKKKIVTSNARENWQGWSVNYSPMNWPEYADVRVNSYPSGFNKMDFGFDSRNRWWYPGYQAFQCCYWQTTWAGTIRYGIDGPWRVRLRTFIEFDGRYSVTWIDL